MATSSVGTHPLGTPLGSAPAPRTAFVDLPAKSTTGRLAAKISTDIVGLLRDHTGRGPTKAKTTIARDVVLVVLEDCLTTLEKQLAAHEETELVTAARHVIHNAIGPEAIALVEAHTNRRVTTYLHDQQHQPDVTVISFILTPPLAIA